jgi:hypothetical protein
MYSVKQHLIVDFKLHTTVSLCLILKLNEVIKRWYNLPKTKELQIIIIKETNHKLFYNLVI